MLADWDAVRAKFVKVIPKDYKRMMEQIEKMNKPV